jgi:hypothetical protein
VGGKLCWGWVGVGLGLGSDGLLCFRLVWSFCIACGSVESVWILSVGLGCDVLGLLGLL